VRSFLAPVLLCALAGACVPTGNAPKEDAGAQADTVPVIRQAPNVLTAVFEDNFDRSPEELDAGPPNTLDAGGSRGKDAGSADAGSPLDEPQTRKKLEMLKGPDGGLFLKKSPLAEDAGGRFIPPGPIATATASAAPSASVATPPAGLEHAFGLGPNWASTQPGAWRIEGGKLCGRGAHNHGVWMTKPIPINARIEFEAMSDAEDGDLKAEVWGDGRSYAKGISYNDATSYLTILGGWKNTLHAVARLDEHGKDRKEIKTSKDTDDPREKPALRGHTYRFKIERTDGKTLRWSVDDLEYIRYEDPTPLAGIGHDHFGFNDWESKVCFDNVKVTPL
jgi:hypothetical protein